MIVHRMAQGSAEWHHIRSGIPTASELGNLVTDKFAHRKGEMPVSYLALKLAEKWLGGPLPTTGSWATEQGKMLEEEAIPWIEFEEGISIDRVGFITNDRGTFGASPDGICGDVGFEIKSYQPVHHVKALLSGTVPEEHLPQIYGSMYATGFKSWRFVAYSRHFPKLLVTVQRDETIMAIIEEALAAFYARMDAAMARLKELNG